MDEKGSSTLTSKSNRSKNVADKTTLVKEFKANAKSNAALAATKTTTTATPASVMREPNVKEIDAASVFANPSVAIKTTINNALTTAATTLTTATMSTTSTSCTATDNISVVASTSSTCMTPAKASSESNNQLNKQKEQVVGQQQQQPQQQQQQQQLQDSKQHTSSNQAAGAAAAVAAQLNMPSSQNTPIRKMRPPHEYVEHLFPHIAETHRLLRYAIASINDSSFQQKIMQAINQYISGCRNDFDSATTSILKCRKLARNVARTLELIQSNCTLFSKVLLESHEYLFRMSELVAIYISCELSYAKEFKEHKPIIANRISNIIYKHLKVPNEDVTKVNILRMLVYMPKMYKEREVMTKIFQEFIPKEQVIIQQELPDKIYIQYLIVFYQWKLLEIDVEEQMRVIDFANKYMRPTKTLCTNATYARHLPKYESCRTATKYILENLKFFLDLRNASIYDNRFQSGIEVMDLAYEEPVKLNRKESFAEVFAAVEIKTIKKPVKLEDQIVVATIDLTIDEIDYNEQNIAVDKWLKDLHRNALKLIPMSRSRDVTVTSNAFRALNTASNEVIDISDSEDELDNSATNSTAAKVTTTAGVTTDNAENEPELFGDFDCEEPERIDCRQRYVDGNLSDNSFDDLANDNDDNETFTLGTRRFNTNLRTYAAKTPAEVRNSQIMQADSPTFNSIASSAASTVGVPSSERNFSMPRIVDSFSCGRNDALWLPTALRNNNMLSRSNTSQDNVRNYTYTSSIQDNDEEDNEEERTNLSLYRTNKDTSRSAASRFGGSAFLGGKVVFSQQRYNSYMDSQEPDDSDADLSQFECSQRVNKNQTIKRVQFTENLIDGPTQRHSFNSSPSRPIKPAINVNKINNQRGIFATQPFQLYNCASPASSTSSTCLKQKMQKDHIDAIPELFSTYDIFGGKPKPITVGKTTTAAKQSIVPNNNLAKPINAAKKTTHSLQNIFELRATSSMFCFSPGSRTSISPSGVSAVTSSQPTDEPLIIDPSIKLRKCRVEIELNEYLENYKVTFYNRLLEMQRQRSLERQRKREQHQEEQQRMLNEKLQEEVQLKAQIEELKQQQQLKKDLKKKQKLQIKKKTEMKKAKNMNEDATAEEQALDIVEQQSVVQQQSVDTKRQPAHKNIVKKIRNRSHTIDDRGIFKKNKDLSISRLSAVLNKTTSESIAVSPINPPIIPCSKSPMTKNLKVRVKKLHHIAESARSQTLLEDQKSDRKSEMRTRRLRLNENIGNHDEAETDAEVTAEAIAEATTEVTSEVTAETMLQTEEGEKSQNEKSCSETPLRTSESDDKGKEINGDGNAIIEAEVDLELNKLSLEKERVMQNDVLQSNRLPVEKQITFPQPFLLENRTSNKLKKKHVFKEKLIGVKKPKSGQVKKVGQKSKMNKITLPMPTVASGIVATNNASTATETTNDTTLVLKETNKQILAEVQMIEAEVQKEISTNVKAGVANSLTLLANTATITAPKVTTKETEVTTKARLNVAEPEPPDELAALSISVTTPTPPPLLLQPPKAPTRLLPSSAPVDSNEQQSNCDHCVPLCGNKSAELVVAHVAEVSNVKEPTMALLNLETTATVPAYLFNGESRDVPTPTLALMATPVVAESLENGMLVVARENPPEIAVDSSLRLEAMSPTSPQASAEPTPPPPPPPSPPPPPPPPVSLTASTLLTTTTNSAASDISISSDHEVSSTQEITCEPTQRNFNSVELQPTELPPDSTTMLVQNNQVGTTHHLPEMSYNMRRRLRKLSTHDETSKSSLEVLRQCPINKRRKTFCAESLTLSSSSFSSCSSTPTSADVLVLGNNSNNTSSGTSPSTTTLTEEKKPTRKRGRVKNNAASQGITKLSISIPMQKIRKVSTNPALAPTAPAAPAPPVAAVTNTLAAAPSTALAVALAAAEEPTLRANCDSPGDSMLPPLKHIQRTYTKNNVAQKVFVPNDIEKCLVNFEAMNELGSKVETTTSTVVDVLLPAASSSKTTKSAATKANSTYITVKGAKLKVLPKVAAKPAKSARPNAADNKPHVAQAVKTSSDNRTKSGTGPKARKRK